MCQVDGWDHSHNSCGRTRQKCCHLAPIRTFPSCINSFFSMFSSCKRSAGKEAPSDRRHVISVLSNRISQQKFRAKFTAYTEIGMRLSAHCRTRQFLGAFAKLRKATIRFVMSVSPQGTIRLPLD